MKHFILKDWILTPKGKTWYHIDSDTLHHYESDGRHSWFPHLAEKTWFSMEMFLELIKFSKKKFPNVDFTDAIKQGMDAFKMKKI